MPTEQARTGSSRPRFSIVTAVYDVGRYLEAFIEAIESQRFPADRFEVIAVDDGSTDNSPELLRAWAERRPELVRVLTKENGGQSTARNLGLEHARGEWVTFTDPDDVIEPDYLTEVDAFLSANPDTEMVACNMLMLSDASGEVTDTHPLRHRFRGKPRQRDLDTHPAFFFVSAPVAFFRGDLIRSLDLRFDPRVRPNFEDGHFAGRYLLALEHPLVGFVPTARYQYRKRDDASSTLGQSGADPDRYTSVFRHGYLDLLRRAAESRDGSVPQWLQNLVLYEISWVLSAQDRVGGASSVLAVADEFHALMAEVLSLLDPAVIDATPVTRVKRLWRDLLLYAYAPEPWRQEYALLTRLDDEQGLVQAVYRYAGPAPVERILSDGRPVEPAYATVRDHRVVGRALLHERILWLPAGGPLRIQLDGRDLPLELAPPPRTTFTANPQAIWRRLDRNGQRKAAPVEAPKPTLVARLARSRAVRARLGGAWLVMDRVHDAGDNGQRLFEYLRAERPEINAWFTVERGTAAWSALRKEHGRRVVPYGSLRWKLLVLNADHLLSSHADVPVVEPVELADVGMDPHWRFTFLQHGVIKDDLSGWLNGKPIDTFVTSTPAEQESIVADHTGYVFTEREAVLTGLPRFDRLRRVGERFPVDQRDLVLVAPTWRSWLTGRLEPGSQRRGLARGALDSEFVRTWTEVLSSERLGKIAEAYAVTVAFLPHPNLTAVLDELALPSWVRPMTFEDGDPQELFARSAVLLTDYSSVAFNAAYIDRPVVYFQFDRDRVLGGDHVGSRGYFDYARDGYGPVVDDPDAAIDAVAEALRNGRVPAPEFQRRIDEAFPVRDGRCCERVTDAVLASTRKVAVVPAGD